LTAPKAETIDTTIDTIMDPEEQVKKYKELVENIQQCEFALQLAKETLYKFNQGNLAKDLSKKSSE